jgi:DNA-binding transcriptional ArsR family regulator
MSTYSPTQSIQLLSDRLNPEKLDQCADMLKAVAHPIRMSIIDMLNDGRRMTVTEIHERMDLEQAVASHHLSILRNRGLLRSEREGKNTYYSVEMPQVQEVINCVERCHAND